jgi:hypothetical protein
MIKNIFLIFLFSILIKPQVFSQNQQFSDVPKTPKELIKLSKTKYNDGNFSPNY